MAVFWVYKFSVGLGMNWLIRYCGIKEGASRALSFLC